MANIFLLDIIKAMGEKGRQEALLFLNSPFFNRDANAQEIIRLFQSIQKAGPDFAEEDLDKESIYSFVFQGKGFVAGKLDKLMSKLKKLLRLYILTQEYFSAEKEGQLQLDWVSWLREKDLEDRFLLAIKKMKEHEGPGSYSDHLRLLRVAEEDHEWENAHNRFLGDLKIPELIYHLDIYYLNYRCELSNRLLLQQKAAQIQTANIVEDPLAYYVGKYLILKISQDINALLKKEIPTIAEFNLLKSLLAGHKKEIPIEMIKRFKAYLRNYCILLIDRGSSEYIPVLHDMHKEDLESGHLLMNGKLSANSYLNIVQIGIRAQHVAWSKNFTTEYKGRIHGEDKAGFFYQLNLASCLFAENEFEQALDQLPEESPTSYYHLMTRRLELKAYYELDSDLLSYKMDSFRKYIERTAPKSITANLRTMNLNFIYILNQLSQSLPKDRDRSEKILKRIEEKNLICERSWLIEKAKGLM